MRPCISCGKQILDFYNYCGWECHVAFAKKMGGTEHCPNGLPIRSMKADWSMWEHEHGDHPDYKFPVEIEFIGPVDETDREEYKRFCGVEATDDNVRAYRGETHALIYNDSSIAITMYECCYSMWYLRDGTLANEHLWYKKTEHILSQKSVQMIKAGRYEV